MNLISSFHVLKYGQVARNRTFLIVENLSPAYLCTIQKYYYNQTYYLYILEYMSS